MTYIEAKSVNKWLRYGTYTVIINGFYHMNTFQFISWPFFNIFYFYMGHFEALCILEHPYSNIFEYSNDKVDE